MTSNYIVLLVGESGSGKTTIASELEKDGWKQVHSYTTRPPRHEGELGHVFVTERTEEHPAAYTIFHGYEYWATSEQIDESDIYVIDRATCSSTGL